MGIGTTSPTGGATTVVDVYGSSSSAINFHNATSGTTATDGGVVGQYGNDLVLFNYEAGIIQLGTNNTERMRIDSSGRVGIATDSPVSKLDIAWGGYQTSGYALTVGADIGNNSTRTNNTIKYGVVSGVNYSNSEKQVELLTHTSNSVSNTLSLGGAGNTALTSPTEILFLTSSTQNGAGGTERMRIDSGGDVSFRDTSANQGFYWDASAASLGIGTDSPQSPFDVTNSSSGAYTSSNTLTAEQTARLSNLNTTANTAATLLFVTSASGGSGISTISSVGTGAGSTALTFGTRLSGGSVSEKMRIDSSGNLSIGSLQSSGQKILVSDVTASACDGRGIQFRGTQSIADDSTITVTTGNSGLLFVTDNDLGDGALFAVSYKTSVVTKLSDPSDIFAVADTDGKVCVFKSANTLDVTVKNRRGATKAITAVSIIVSD